MRVIGPRIGHVGRGAVIPAQRAWFVDGEDLHQTNECNAEITRKPHAEITPWYPKCICQASNNH